jgi:hypothetical protein
MGIFWSQQNATPNSSNTTQPLNPDPNLHVNQQYSTLPIQPSTNGTFPQHFPPNRLPISYSPHQFESSQNCPQISYEGQIILAHLSNLSSRLTALENTQFLIANPTTLNQTQLPSTNIPNNLSNNLNSQTNQPQYPPTQLPSSQPSISNSPNTQTTNATLLPTKRIQPNKTTISRSNYDKQQCAVHTGYCKNETCKGLCISSVVTNNRQGNIGRYYFTCTICNSFQVWASAPHPPEFQAILEQQHSNNPDNFEWPDPPEVWPSPAWQPPPSPPARTALKVPSATMGKPIKLTSPPTLQSTPQLPQHTTQQQLLPNVSTADFLIQQEIQRQQSTISTPQSNIITLPIPPPPPTPPENNDSDPEPPTKTTKKSTSKKKT